MANYIASCRTNSFSVKDEAKFREWADQYDISISVENDGDNKFCILGEDPDGAGWPSYRYNEETEEYENIDFFAEIAPHLAEGEVAVFMEAGAEKLRYVAGYAVAVAWTGESKTVSLNDIYDLAKTNFVGCNEISMCEH